jgi:predicted nucleic acid-binding protein
MFEAFISHFHGKVIIPEKVKAEVCIEGREETPLIVKLIEDKKIRVSKAMNSALTRKLMKDFTIDAGGAEVLTLALQEKALLIASDDRNTIRACKMLKIDFTTAISILIRAFEKKFVDKEEALSKLQKLGAVARYKETIIESARKQIEGG